MRVVLFSFDYAPLDGGIARLCTELSRGLSDAGVDLSVVTADSAAASPAAGVVRVAGSRPARDLRALRLLRQLPSDSVVLCGRWYPEGLLALLAGRKSVAILVHGAELLAARFARLSSARQAVRRRVLEAACVVVANSRYTGELARSVAPRARVVALPLGVDVTAFSPGDRDSARAKLGLHTRYVVSTVARVQSFKGHDTAISALAGLPSHTRSDFTYFVAGRGSHTEALRKLARELGVSDRVTFAGLVPEERLVDVYRASDLFCLMTRRSERAVEGFGLALLEAQSCGIPVLGSNVGGIPDALEDGQTGSLLEPDDVAGVRSHLERLAEDPERYRKVGMAGRARATNRCSWEKYAAGLLEILLERASASRR